MICITEIKVIDVEKDFIEICQREYMSPIKRISGSDPVEHVEVTREMIRGRTFINERGERLCIGMSKQVQDSIGLPFRAFENMSQRIEMDAITISQLRGRSAMYQKRIDTFKMAGIIKRLKYLFTKNC